MTLQLDWPPDLMNRLTQQARQHGLSVDAYLQSLVQPNVPAQAPTNEEKRQRRAAAAACLLEIRMQIQPDPDGWTSREYIKYGRR